MTAPLYSLGHFAARRGRLILAIWLVFAIAVVAFTGVVGSPNNNDLTIPGSGSTAASDLLDDKFPAVANGTNPVVMRADHGRLDEGEKRHAIERTVDAYKNDDRVRSAVNPFSSAGAANVSKNGRYAYIAVTLRVSPEDLDEDAAEELIALADPARDAGLQVAVGGYLGQAVSEADTSSSELIGIGMAIIVLLFAFGTVVAMTIPIFTAVTGLIVGLSLIGLLGHVVSVPSIAATLGTMIGLGVGIDYALFIVTRYRGFLAEGFEVQEAVARAVATAGGAVAFAGGTVIIALVSLYFSGLPIVRALGYSAAVPVAVAVIAATTLLPAVLGLLGKRINSLKLPFGHHHHDDKPHGWMRWAIGVGKRPVSVALLGLVLLLALAVPVLNISLGQPDESQSPGDTQSRQSFDLMADGFGPGYNGPLLVSVELDPKAKADEKKLRQLNAKEQRQQEKVESEAQEAATAGAPVPPSSSAVPSKNEEAELAEQKAFLKSPASDPRLSKLSRAIKQSSDVAAVSPPDVNDERDAAIINVIPNSAPAAERTSTLVRHLRDDVIPGALGSSSGASVYVGGTTAGYIDLADRIGEKLPLVIAIVVILSFFLLLLAFRSLLVPLTAGLMNLVSVAAAYGVLVLVFQEGVGLSLIGLDETTEIVSFVPLLMFAILFGLSMDYQVFLLTRIHERYQAGIGNHDSVVEGLAGTARVITSAALIMVAVFGSFILSGDPTVKQFGVGLAAAVAIDATIVRCLLVPSVMIIFGKANWWFPKRAERFVPRLGIEGEEFINALDEKRGRRGQPEPDAAKRNADG